MIDFISKARYDEEDLKKLVTLLRAPGGCPWDGAQTHLSIRRNFIEEAYEACEGFDRDDPDMICEELGDVLLQVLFHADIERESGRMTLDDICDRECKKLIFRHPFLFGGESGSWDELKQKEKGQRTVAQTMEGVARSLPATWRSEKVLGKAEKGGFAPVSDPQQLGKLEASVRALEEASASGGDTQKAAGEMLFAAVAACRQLGCDPEQALHAACDAFITRFTAMEQAVLADGLQLGELSRDAQARRWDEAGPSVNDITKTI